MRLPALQRYHFERQIGEGATGAVFRVWDRKAERSVALKLLTSLSASALMRFKQEFRSLSEIRHPNVVRIHELASVEEFWFYTMELIEGQELMEHLALQELRGSLESGASFEEIRTRRWDSIYRTVTAPGTVMVPPTSGFSMLSSRYLRNLRISMRQLASGVRAIHHAGFVHRDIKPANIVVTVDGRVVLLDFGLARPSSSSRPDSVHELASLAGTPGYMSPEQAARLPLSEASDWYSFGIVLYQALTGTLPFTGDLFDIIVKQQSEVAPRPSAVVPDTPSDLDELCVRLLARSPAERPLDDEIVASLGGDSFAYWIPDFRAGGLRRGSRFVGREGELGVLHECLAEAMSTDRLCTAEISGGSGSGKTMLVNRFCDEARLVQKLLVLFGRCYSSASVPFNAFDQIFDGVARIESIPRTSPLPRLPSLVRRFPVLGRSEYGPGGEDGDIAGECRRLFEFLSHSRPVLAVIDEAQRADEESLGLLRQLLVDPPAGPILLVVLHSDEDRDARLRSVILDRCYRTIRLGALGLEELRQWANSFLGFGRVEEADLAAILGDTGGDAYLVEQVLVFMSQETNKKPPTVSHILDRKLQRLPRNSLQLLHVLADTDEPLDSDEALLRAGLTGKDDYAIIPLRSERLARSRFIGDHEQIEIYHDRVRDWIRRRS